MYNRRLVSVVFGVVIMLSFTGCGIQNKEQIGKGSSLEYEHKIVDEIPDMESLTGEDLEESDMEYNENSNLAQNENLNSLPKDIVDTTKQRYSYEDMVSDLEELKKVYPNQMELNILTTTKDNRNVYEVIVGNPDAKRHMIIHASIHAREYMTTLLVMKQLEYYLNQYETGTYNDQSYRELFDQIAIHLLPMVNPDGVSISQGIVDENSQISGVRSSTIQEEILRWYERDHTSGATSLTLSRYMERFKANANGVDLNRNFDYGWEEFIGSSQPGAEKYKGTTVESEPETKALVELTRKLEPVAAISYHATGSVIYWDYGQTGSLRESCEALVDRIHEVTGYEIKYAATDKQDAAGYGDWAVMVEQIPSATVEIGTGTAPLAIDEFTYIWDRNREMWAALTSMYYE